jgi:hypothetical protein
MALPKALTAAGMFKNISPSVKLLLKPMLLLSLGLHGIVLFTPLPAPSPKAELPKSKPIKIVKLPPLRTAPKPLTKRPNSKKPSTPKIVSSTPRLGIVLKQKQETGTTPNKFQPKLDPRPSRSSDPPSDPSTTEGDTWDDLPKYSKNIQNPCEGADGCVQTGDSFGDVTQYFENNLSAKKFKFFKENVPEGSYGTEYRAYKVINSKKEVQFLSILFNGENTKYVWADRIASEVDIVTKTITPMDITTFIQQLPTQFVDASKAKVLPERFPETAVTKFYIDKDTPDFGFRNTRANAPIIVSSNPIDTYQTLAEKLSSANYNATTISTGYAGGTLYEIKKSDLPKPLYLTIVPTKQGDGSIVALWLDMPQ